MSVSWKLFHTNEQDVDCAQKFQFYNEFNYPAVVSFPPRIISDSIQLHRFRFSFVHALSCDVFFIKSTIYRPVRNFQKWTCKVQKISQYHIHIDFVILYLRPKCPLLIPLI